MGVGIMCVMCEPRKERRETGGTGIREGQHRSAKKKLTLRKMKERRKGGETPSG